MSPLSTARRTHPCDLGVAGTARRREAALASSGQSRRQRLAFCGSAAGERSGRSVALRLTTARTIFRREQSRGCAQSLNRKSVVEGKSVSVRVDLGGCRTTKKKNKHK